METDKQYSIYLKLRGHRRDQLQAWFSEVLRAIRPYLRHEWLVTGAYQRLSASLYTRPEEASQVGDKEPFLYFSSDARRDPALPDAYPIVLNASGSPDLKHLVRTLNAIGDHVVQRYLEWSDRDKLLSFEELGITSGKDYYRSFMYTPAFSENQSVQALPQELLTLEELGITDVVKFPAGMAEPVQESVSAEEGTDEALQDTGDAEVVEPAVAVAQPVAAAPPKAEKRPAPDPVSVPKAKVATAPASQPVKKADQQPAKVRAEAKRVVEQVAASESRSDKAAVKASSQPSALAKKASVAEPDAAGVAGSVADAGAVKPASPPAPENDPASRLLELLQKNQKAQKRYHLSDGALFVTVPDAGVCYSSVPLGSLGGFIAQSGKIIPESCSLAQVQALRGSLQGYPLSHLTWCVAFAVSADVIQARLGSRKVGIKAWPDLGLPDIRQHLRLATYLMNNVADVNAVAEATGVPVDIVCRFYNACEVMGISRPLDKG